MKKLLALLAISIFLYTGLNHCCEIDFFAEQSSCHTTDKPIQSIQQNCNCSNHSFFNIASISTNEVTILKKQKNSTSPVFNYIVQIYISPMTFLFGLQKQKFQLQKTLLIYLTNLTLLI